MNFDYLNKMIDYIEDNLDREIDFDKLSRITNLNLFILERIFMFLTNMTIVEYIKKRRLSKAFEEIRNTNQKIIDIAFKYQYNSSPSFNRAFKQLFNMTPTECRNSTATYKIIPREYFENTKGNYNFDYEIKEIDDINIYCCHISSNTYSDLLYKIRQLYKMVKTTPNYKEFNEVGMYGIYSKDNDKYHYYLGSKKNISNLDNYTISKCKYAVFKLMSRCQKDIVELEELLDIRWLPSTNYNIKESTRIEYYLDNICYIYLPIM